MARNTEIEWADTTFNPIMGCTPVSEACEHCYARSMIRRFGGHNKGFPENPGDVTLYPERLEQPLHWRDPQRVFVCSMSDLFHPDVPFEYIEDVFDVMGRAPRHTFMILTKRPERLLEFVRWQAAETGEGYLNNGNVWLGVTAENQARADERIPILLRVPAPVHFVSIEPMLGPVDLKYPEGSNPAEYCCSGSACACRGLPIYPPLTYYLDWVIAGGETGPGARLMRAEWVRDLAQQCQDADIPFFFKKWGGAKRASEDASLARLMGYDSSYPHGGGRFNWAEREFPGGE